MERVFNKKGMAYKSHNRLPIDVNYKAFGAGGVLILAVVYCTFWHFSFVYIKLPS